MMSIEPRNELRMLRWFRRYQLLAAAAAEALPRRRRGPSTTGAGLQQLARRAQAGAGGAAAPGRREPADGGCAPPGRAPGRGTGGGRSCATVNEEAHGFNQRPRFEQVVGYLERNEPLPLDQPDRKATSFITSHFYLDDFVQSSEDPNPPSTVRRVRRNPLC